MQVVPKNRHAEPGEEMNRDGGTLAPAHNSVLAGEEEDLYRIACCVALVRLYLLHIFEMDCYWCCRYIWAVVSQPWALTEMGLDLVDCQQGGTYTEMGPCCAARALLLPTSSIRRKTSRFPLGILLIRPPRDQLRSRIHPVGRTLIKPPRADGCGGTDLGATFLG